MKNIITALFLLCGISFHADAQEMKLWNQTRPAPSNPSLAKKHIVIAPYTSLQVEGNMISLLGRKVELDKNGFPKQIQTFFNPNATQIVDEPNNLLAENIHFHFVRKTDGKNIKFIEGGVEFIKKENRICTVDNQKFQ